MMPLIKINQNLEIHSNQNSKNKLDGKELAVYIKEYKQT
jgi:hypothetical protein